MTTVSAMAALAATAFVALAPRERRFVAVRVGSVLEQTRRVIVNLQDRALVGIYLSAFLLMGGFVAVYNYLGFRLTAEPYLLPGWVVGLVFLAYLAGTVSAPVRGSWPPGTGGMPCSPAAWSSCWPASCSPSPRRCGWC